MFRDYDYTMVENTVLFSHDGIITEKCSDIPPNYYPLYYIKDQQNTQFIRK